ncbi:MAG: class I SAM-dependent methyltransferase [Pseudomonadota bacterium]
MRTETEMVAYALEVEPRLLPWMPELLSDFDELGSDAGTIVEVLKRLDLPASARIVDLGCGKGAVSIAVAQALGCRVEGIELFQPFIEICNQQASAAGVADLCRFRHGDIVRLSGQIEPADVAIYAALGDVLGSFETVVEIVRRFVRTGGIMLICEGYIKPGQSSDFPVFENYLSREEMLQRLQAKGDVLAYEWIDTEDRSSDYAGEIAQLRQRAERLAEQQPELETELMQFIADQQDEYAFMAEYFVSAIWALQRVD